MVAAISKEIKIGINKEYFTLIYGMLTGTLQKERF